MHPISDNTYLNPLSGRNSAGPRFQFRVRSIARKNLYLPLSMKSLPEILRLIKGESPVDVFRCKSIKEARKAFYLLRKRYDFPYWAALDCSVPDRDNPSKIVPLMLNRHQHHVADVFLRRVVKGKRSIFLISKSIQKCGLTTVVQAYSIWLQLLSWHSNSILYTFASDELNRFKANLCRILKKTKIYEGGTIFVPDTDAITYFNTIMSSDIQSGIDCSLIHLADMSKWNDRTAEKSSLIFSSTLSRLRENPTALVVMEGDKPIDPKIRDVVKGNILLPEQIRYLKLEAFGINPFFIDKWLMVSDHDRPTFIRHIDLDSIP